MTNDGRPHEASASDDPAARIALPAVAAAWTAVFVMLTIIASGEEGLGRGALLALAITGSATLTAHSVVAVHDRAAGPWRWPAMALTLLALGSVAHALLARLGMTQSWGQDLLNLTMICGVALAVRLAWAGYRARRALEGEIARRREVEGRLETATSAAARPNGPVPVKVGHGQALLDPTAVSLLEADGNFARVQTADGVVFVSESLKTLAERFAPYGFVRVHKSYAVNRALVRVRTGEGLELADGRRAPIGRAFRAALD